MKRINIIYLAFCAAAFAACDKDVNNANLTPNMVYIVNSGVNDVETYNVGKDHVFRLGLYKSGALNSPASVQLAIMTQEELDIYNTENGTNFALMPESCYDISGMQLNFSNAVRDVSRSVDVVLKLDVIENLLAIAQSYVVPIKIDDASIEVNRGKSVCIVKPEIKTATVGMTGLLTDKYTFPYPVAVDLDRLIDVELVVENEWEIGCSFEVDEDYIDSYNTANGTSFSLLPSDCYTFPTAITIAAPSSIVSFSLEIDEDKIPAGRYLLPVRLKSVSRFEIAQDASLYVLELKINAPELDRTEWTANDNTHAGGYEAVLALDGNPATFWHCNWSPVPSLPHQVTIDMGQEYSLGQIGLLQRSDFDMLNTGEILVGDGVDQWTKVAEFTMPTGVGSSLVIDLDNIVQTRYFRVSITGSRRPDYSTAIAEITAYGY